MESEDCKDWSTGGSCVSVMVVGDGIKGGNCSGGISGGFVVCEMEGISSVWVYRDINGFGFSDAFLFLCLSVISILSFSPEDDSFKPTSGEVVGFSLSESLFTIEFLIVCDFVAVTCVWGTSGFSTKVCLFRLNVGQVLLKWVFSSQSLLVGR
jgi:hypothetical protein